MRIFQSFLPLLALQRPFTSLRTMSSYTQKDLPNITLNDNVQVPVIGYGLGTANYAKDVKDGVMLAFKTGYAHWDGAEVYKNEASEAAALKELGVKRSEVFITSKVGSDDPRASLEKSLKLLETDYVDLYLIHSPEFVRKTGLGEAWKVMEQLQAEGKARSIGVSNYRIKDLEETLEVAKVVPSANQVRAQGQRSFPGKSHALKLVARLNTTHTSSTRPNRSSHSARAKGSPSSRMVRNPRSPSSQAVRSTLFSPRSPSVTTSPRAPSCCDGLNRRPMGSS